MNLILVLVFVFGAISAQDPIQTSSEKYLDFDEPTIARLNIQKMVKDLIQKSKGFLKETTANLNKLVPQIKNKVNNLFDKNVEKLNEIIQKTDRNLSNLVTKNKLAIVCVTRFGLQMKSIFKSAKNHIETCRKNAQNQVEVIKGEFVTQIKGLLPDTDAIKKVFKDCSKNSVNPVFISKCVYTQYQTIMTSIKNIVSKAKEALVERSNEMADVISTGEECISSRDIDSEIKTVFQQLNLCIKLAH